MDNDRRDSNISEFAPYKAIKALLITWKDAEEKDFAIQRDSLEKEFKLYGFGVEKFCIESDKPHRSLVPRLQQFLLNDKADSLLILYYGGHGMNNLDKEHIWLCKKPTKKRTKKPQSNPKINWTALQTLFLDECQSHVLFLLDCCYAAATVRYTHSSSTVEAIVASGFERVAPLEGKDSFTMALINAMSDQRLKIKETVTAGALCRMVAARLNTTDPNIINPSVRSTPHHIQFYNYGKNITLGQLAVTQHDEYESKSSPETHGDEPRPSTPWVERGEERYIDWKEDSLEAPRGEQIGAEEVTGDERVGSSIAGDDKDIRDKKGDIPNKENMKMVYIEGKREASPIASQSDTQLTPSGSFWRYRQISSNPEKTKPPYTDIGVRQIRILHILANDNVSESILGHFVVSDIYPQGGGPSDWPVYKVVSYVWGEKWSEIYIFDNKFENRYPVKVPSSLVNALRRLRHSQEKTAIWADAACIQQHHEEEKLQHIDLIPVICQNASEVIVWLGEEDQQSNTAMDFIHRVVNLEEFDLLIKSDDTPHQWEALVNLMRRPWFRTRWAFQEIILTKRASLHCGSRTVPWADFCDVIVLLGACFEDVQYKLKRYEISNSLRHTFGNLIDLRALEAYSIVEAARDLFRGQNDGVFLSTCDMETLVSFLPALQSSNVNDVIYALYSVSSDCRGKPYISNDYSKPATQTYQEFLSHCVKRSKSLDIICRPWAPKNIPPEFPRTERIPIIPQESPPTHRIPTWICQVDNLPFGHRRKNIYGRKNGDVFVGNPKRNYYNAAKGSAASPVFGTPLDNGGVNWDGTMIVSGFEMGNVDKLGFRAAGGTIHMEWIEICGWKKGDTTVPHHLWRTLVADRGPGGIPAPSWYHIACQYWLDYSEGHDITYDVIQRDQHPSTALEYMQRVQSVIWDRTLFRTKYIHEFGWPLFGLGPKGTELGDRICILHGCSVPVMLRPIGWHWELVGECFVYGMMDGEAMQAQLFADSTREFVLK